MQRVHGLWAGVISAAIVAASSASGAVQPLAWYRLGDDDPGAVPGAVGNNPTLDHSPYHLDLTRGGAPRYTADVPPNLAASVFPNKLAMSFFNYNGPTLVYAPPSYYARALNAATTPPAFGLECWVRSSQLPQPDSSGYALIACNGDPFRSGIGFFQHGKNYVVRIGQYYEKVLAPVRSGSWTHLAFWRWNSINDFYVNGLEQPDASAAAQVAPSLVGGSFFVAGYGFPGSPLTVMPKYLFNGQIDEARFFTLSAVPTTSDLLISHIPRDLSWAGGPGATWNTTSPVWSSASGSAAWSNLAPDNAAFSGGSIALAGEITAGKLTFSAGSTTLSGGSLQLVAPLGVGLSADAPALIDAPVTLVNEQEWNVAGAVAAGSVSGAALTKTGSATLAIASLSADGLAVNTGRVEVTGGSVIRLGALSVAPGAELDTGTSDLVLDYTGAASPFASVRSQQLDGRLTCAGTSAVLALFDNALVGAGDWPIGSGQGVSAACVIGKYTLFGDANLDGLVSADDYALLDANLGATPPAGIAWLSGDANLDGQVTSDDYAILDANLGGSMSPLSAVPAPEPGGLLLAGALLLRSRGRRP